jgi:2'-5' RNA ligase
MAHITLVPPFLVAEHKLESIIQKIDNYCKQRPKIEIMINGFNRFKSQVLFLDIKYPYALLQIFADMQALIKNFTLEVRSYTNFHPHITIIQNDIKEEKFKLAYEYFNLTYPYRRTSELQELALFRLTENKWEIHTRFPLLVLG